MQLDKAIEIVKLVIASKNEKNEIQIKDNLQFSIAITIISNSLSVEQIQELLN
jgi:hypothetical protein